MIDRLLSLGIRPICAESSHWSSVKRRSSGVIVAQNGCFHELNLFWFPRYTTVWRVWFDQYFRRVASDQCRIYFRQPFSAPKYLAVEYFVSGWRTSVQTVDSALRVLDYVAELKKSDAIVAQLKNSRISSRLLRRYGWERHLGDRASRHIIRRFYGVYPSSNARIRGAIAMEGSPLLCSSSEMLGR